MDARAEDAMKQALAWDKQNNIEDDDKDDGEMDMAGETDAADAAKHRK